MTVEGSHGNRGLLPLARASDFDLLPALPGTHAIAVRVDGRPVMDVVHRRCAGLDISKKDAKVAVRVAGGGRAGTKTTVTTWSSMTGQVLALREHLVAAQVTCVVREATSDYWKPFYYVLEDGPWELMLVAPAMPATCPDPRPTSRMRRGWLSSERTAWSVARSCHRRRSGRCAT